STLVLFGIVGGLSIYSLRASDEALRTLHEERLTTTWMVGNVYSLVQDSMLRHGSALGVRSVPFSKQSEERFQQNRAAINSLYDPYLARELPPRERELAEQFDADRTAFHELLVEGFELQKDGDFDASEMFYQMRIMPAFEKLNVQASELLDMQLAASERLREELLAESNFKQRFVIGLFAWGVLGTIIFGGALILSMRNSIRQTLAFAERISDGQLGNRMEVHGRNELADIMRALQQMDARLVEIVSEVREGSDAVSAAAVQISQGNDDLAQRTQEQASSLEETASTVRQTADHARQANQLAAGAREQAEKGGEVVTSAVAAMREINAASKKIADIIGVIDEIAFQTNLLALNAAVEAARAGE